MLGCRSEAGRLFQILAPATEKLLSPSRVFVLGTVTTLARAERSGAGSVQSPRSAGSRRPGTMELICWDSYAPAWRSLTMMMTMMMIKIDYQLSPVTLRTESIVIRLQVSWPLNLGDMMTSSFK